MSELGKDPRPSVILPRELVPLPVAIGLGAVMAFALLVYLLSNQTSQEDTVGRLQIPAQKAPPELFIPPDPALRTREPFLATVIQPEARAVEPIPRFVPQVQPQYALPPRYEEASNNVSEGRMERRDQPIGSDGSPIAIDLSRGRGGNFEQGSIEGMSEGERPQLANDVVRATQIRNRITTIPQGAIIAAVLETPLDSDRPGLARAIVSQDVRGFDGTRVLIPRGSRLIGEFKAEVTPGLRRIPVIWTRLIRPDGVAIRIASPGADPLGGAGIAGKVNTHFGARLLNSVLQSALTVGVNVLSSSSSIGGNPIYVGLPGQAQQVGEQLAPKVERPPTVRVKAGAEISVLVARDLDFSGTPAVR